MSMAALRLLRRVWVEGPAKAVLLVLADHANDQHWSSFLSQETIAFEAGVSRSTVQRTLSRLRGQGLIRVEERGGTQYGRSSNITHLVRSALEERASLSPVDQKWQAFRRQLYGGTEAPQGVTGTSPGVQHSLPAMREAKKEEAKGKPGAFRGGGFGVAMGRSAR